VIYVVMVDDRHKDPQAHLYLDESAAIDAARAAAAEMGLAEQPTPAADDPWRFLATGPEGDGVWVVGQEVIS
jgi:hypothetical protein